MVLSKRRCRCIVLGDRWARQTAGQRLHELVARTECRRGGLVTAYGRKARRGWYQQSLHFYLDRPEVGGGLPRG